MSSLTRVQGATLAVPLAMLAWPAVARPGPVRRRVHACVGPLGPLLGALLAEGYGMLVAGGPGPIAQQTTDNGWTIVAPGWPLVAAGLELWRTPPEHWVAAQWVSLPLVLLSLGFLAWGWRRLPGYLNWYGVAVLLPGLVVLRYPALAGTPCYLLLCVPLFVSLALWARRSAARRVALVVVSLGWQLSLVALFSRWAWIA